MGNFKWFNILIYQFVKLCYNTFSDIKFQCTTIHFKSGNKHDVIQTQLKKAFVYTMEKDFTTATTLLNEDENNQNNKGSADADTKIDTKHVTITLPKHVSLLRKTLQNKRIVLYNRTLFLTQKRHFEIDCDTVVYKATSHSCFVPPSINFIITMFCINMFI